MLGRPAAGQQIKDALKFLPQLSMDCNISPITRSVLRVSVMVYPEFKWNDTVHGTSMRWVLWVEDTERLRIYHQETWTLTKKMMGESEHRLVFTIPISEPLPPQVTPSSCVCYFPHD